MADLRLRALNVLRRLRRVETDGARRELGDALAREAAIARQNDAIARELEQARQVSGYFDREAFSAWFDRMSTERARVAASMLEAETRTAASRAGLAHRRVAQTAAEDALAREATAREAEVARRDQLILEDVARALKRAPPTG